MSEIVYDKNGNAHEVVDFNRDDEGARQGMWLFLFTELMLFGGLFITYAVYFFDYTQGFIEASKNMNLWLGGLNTVILLISAATLALSVVHMKMNKVAESKNFLYATIALAIAFIVVKYFEWSAEFHHGIWPDSPTLVAMSNGANMYFGLYFTLTGLHGLHIILGIVAMFWVLGKMNKGEIHSKNYVVLENFTLYWDYVHLVWVFVVPLFYMIGLSTGGTH